MAKQTVRQNEHKSEPQAPAGSAVVPAPMVERAFRLLEILSASEEGLTLSELARVLDMSKGSIHGLLKTLESNHVIEQSEERLYVLGPRLYDLAQNYVQRAGLRRFALPAMQRLAANIGETLFLGRVEQESVRIIECIKPDMEAGLASTRFTPTGTGFVPAQPSLHISAPRGTRVHLLAGATGRVILASWPREQRECYLRTTPLPRFTAHSITDPEQFLAAVEETRCTGIGEDHEEYLTGVNAVATAIRGPDSSLVALLWIVGFSSRFNEKTIRNVQQQLLMEATMISKALGAREEAQEGLTCSEASPARCSE
ncbi:MAG TPA: IclR family transcriptional regulator [Ktedonobacteraceae bacterium]|nr:IclR family transcriptional regulator [Ktedonobacteraceae bacterium]